MIFLDEPTVGLDPQARLGLWTILRELHAQGRTIVMTTHYMEEADRLCDRVAVVDQGRLLAIDTPAALKARAPGGTMIDLMLDGGGDSLGDAARAIPGVSSAEAKGNTLRVYSDRGGEVIAALVTIASRTAARFATSILRRRASKRCSSHSPDASSHDRHSRTSRSAPPREEFFSRSSGATSTSRAGSSPTFCCARRCSRCSSSSSSACCCHAWAT